MLEPPGDLSPGSSLPSVEQHATIDCGNVTRRVLRAELQQELATACDRILDGVQQQLQKFLQAPARDGLRLAASGEIVGKNPSIKDDGSSPWSFEIRKSPKKNKASNSTDENDSDHEDSEGPAFVKTASLLSTEGPAFVKTASLLSTDRRDLAPLCFEIRRRGIEERKGGKEHPVNGHVPEKGSVPEKRKESHEKDNQNKGGNGSTWERHSAPEECSAPEKPEVPAAAEKPSSPEQEKFKFLNASRLGAERMVMTDDEAAFAASTYGRTRSSTFESKSSPKSLSRKGTSTSLSTHLSHGSEGVGFTHHVQRWMVKEEARRMAENVRLSRSLSLHEDKSCMGKMAHYLRVVRHSIKSFVRSSYLDYFSTVLILLNALQLGAQTDIAARTLNKEDHLFFKVSEYTFGFCFVVELVLKIYVHRWDFFCTSGCSWNFFDFFIVGIQVVEVIMDVITAFVVPSEKQLEDESGGDRSSFSVMRVLRLLRLVRVLRMVRIMHLVSELRTIIVAIFSSLRSLAWTMLLLFLIMYLFGVYLTQLVTDERKGSSCSGKCDEILGKYFGSLSAAILVLYQVITGGINWSDVVDALIEYISPLLALPFSLYIAFVIFALMNVVTGVFVESALKSTKTDSDIVLFHQLLHLLRILDTNGTGTISWEEFECGLHRPEMVRVFKSIDLGVDEAKDLFRLIDIDGSGEISFDEFTNGCLRLRGPAKAIDMAAFMFDYKHSIGALKEHGRIVEDMLAWIAQGGLHELAQQMQVPLLGTTGTQADLDPKIRVKLSL